MAAFRSGLTVALLSLTLGTAAWGAAPKQLPQRALPQGREPAPVVGEDMIVNEPHRTWWNTYHAGEPYQAAQALAAHRLFCQDHPSDSTCIGWDWH